MTLPIDEFAFAPSGCDLEKSSDYLTRNGLAYLAC